MIEEESADLAIPSGLSLFGLDYLPIHIVHLLPSLLPLHQGFWPLRFALI